MDLGTGPFSPIYLGGKIKRLAGLPQSALDVLLDRTERSFPIISQIYTKRADGITVRGLPYGDSTIDAYRAVSYDLLLGRGFAEKTLADTASRSQ
jgi:hypothetical protein